MMKIKRCFLGIIVLGALASGVAWAEPTATNSAAGVEQGARHESAGGVKRGARHDPATGVKQGARHDSGPGVKQGARHESASGVKQGARHDSDPGVKQGAQHGSANGVKHGVQQGSRRAERQGVTTARRHEGVAARRPAQNGAWRPSLKAPDRAVATDPGGGKKGLATAGTIPDRHVAAASRFIPSAASPGTGAAVSGNAVARHTPVKAGVGGPIAYDAKKGGLVIIGGTAMRRR